jgi:bacterioferritin-associated ferredoxin
MIVCHCRVVNDATIREVIHAGARDCVEVAERCGAGGACGGCVPSVEELLADAAMALASPITLRDRQALRREHERPVAIPA